MRTRVPSDAVGFVSVIPGAVEIVEALAAYVTAFVVTVPVKGFVDIAADDTAVSRPYVSYVMTGTADALPVVPGVTPDAGKSPATSARKEGAPAPEVGPENT